MLSPETRREILRQFGLLAQAAGGKDPEKMSDGELRHATTNVAAIGRKMMETGYMETATRKQATTPR